MKHSLPIVIQIFVQISWNIWFMLENLVISDVDPYNNEKHRGAYDS